MRHFSESTFRTQAEHDGITHISTGVAIVKDKKILIVRRAADDYLGGQYELPGGGVDDDEAIADAANREVREETGLTVSKVISVFDGFDYGTDRKPHVRQINFLVEAFEGEVLLNPDEHDAYQWIDSVDGLDESMSPSMKKCVIEALRLAKQIRLYLFTLEVDPLNVNASYDPLPPHLTLVSRFWSELSSDVITDTVRPTFAQAEPIKLIFGREAIIGPKKTAVHLIENTSELKNLHSQLLDNLTELNVSFTSPQFIGEGHKPHVSKRDGIRFMEGHKQSALNAYLIEVVRDGVADIRNIRTEFKLGN